MNQGRDAIDRRTASGTGGHQGCANIVDACGDYWIEWAGKSGSFDLCWRSKGGSARRLRLGRIGIEDASSAMRRCATNASMSPKDLLRRAERIEESAGLWIERRLGSASIFLGWYDERARQTRHVSLRTSDVGMARRQLYRCVDSRGEDPRKVLARPRPLTLSEMLDAYLAEHASSLPSAEQAKIAASRIKALAGHRYCEFFDYEDSRKLAKSLIEEGKSVAYASRILSVLRSSYNLSRRKKLIATAPIVFEPRTAAHMEAEPLKGDYLEPEEIARLIDEASAMHVLQALVLLINTGARIRSLLDLRPEQVDLKTNLIRLNPAGRIQTKKRRPTIRIPATLRPWLLDREPGQCLVSRNGEPVKSVKTAFRGMRARAGLGDRVNTYSIRHTLARWMERQRVPDKQVSVVLGHVPVSVKRTTLRYTERPEAPEYLREATASIESFVREIASHLRRVDVLTPPWLHADAGNSVTPVLRPDFPDEEGAFHD